MQTKRFHDKTYKQTDKKLFEVTLTDNIAMTSESKMKCLKERCSSKNSRL